MEKSYNKLENACQLIEKEWFDRFFIDYFSKDGAAYKHYIRVKRYKLTDNNVSSRVLNHWVNKGIFHDDRKDKKGWKIFSITDTVLLTIIKRLRLFGLDLDRIKKVADNQKEYSYSDEYNVMYEGIKDSDWKIDIKNKEFLVEELRERKQSGRIRSKQKDLCIK